MRSFHCPSPYQRRETGFTLIECLAAFAIFSLMITFMGSGIGSHLKNNNENEIRTGAVEAVEFQLDELRSRRGVRGVISLSGIEGPQLTTIDGREYEVFSEYCPSEGITYCSEHSRYVKVRALYGDKKWYEASTIYTDLSRGSAPTPAPRSTRMPPTPPATLSPTPTTPPLASPTPAPRETPGPTGPSGPGPLITPTPISPTPTRTPTLTPTYRPPTRTPTPRPTSTPFPLT